MKLNRDYPAPPAIKNVRFINLGKGNFAKVDKEDYNFISDRFWYFSVNKHTNYVATKKNKNIKIKSTILRREILSRYFNIKNKSIIHIDGDPLNCCKKNLLIIKRYYQSKNSKKQQKETTSKYKGVSFHQTIKKWQVHIYMNGKSKSLGYYNCEEDAARRYDQVAVIEFGKLARTNAMMFGDF